MSRTHGLVAFPLPVVRMQQLQFHAVACTPAAMNRSVPFAVATPTAHANALSLPRCCSYRRCFSSGAA